MCIPFFFFTIATFCNVDYIFEWQFKFLFIMQKELNDTHYRKQYHREKKHKNYSRNEKQDEKSLRKLLYK